MCVCVCVCVYVCVCVCFNAPCICSDKQLGGADVFSFCRAPRRAQSGHFRMSCCLHTRRLGQDSAASGRRKEGGRVDTTCATPPAQDECPTHKRMSTCPPGPTAQLLPSYASMTDFESSTGATRMSERACARDGNKALPMSHSKLQAHDIYAAWRERERAELSILEEGNVASDDKENTPEVVMPAKMAIKSTVARRCFMCNRIRHRCVRARVYACMIYTHAYTKSLRARTCAVQSHLTGERMCYADSRPLSAARMECHLVWVPALCKPLADSQQQHVESREAACPCHIHCRQRSDCRRSARGKTASKSC